MAQFNESLVHGGVAVAEAPTGAAGSARGTMVGARASLSQRLKARTAVCHADVEALLALPSAIRDRRDYEEWLARFLGFYEPLESALAAVGRFAGTEAGLLQSHADRIVADLRSLGVDPLGPARASPAQLPPLPTAAHAAGARYVLMGATLGGRYILRNLDARLGSVLEGATRFFDASGPLTGRDWLAYREALDRFGDRHPAVHADVEDGAVATFVALHDWFVPFCNAGGRSR